MNWRRTRRLTAGAAVGALILFLLSPTGCYLSRAGWEEAKILKRRKQIDRVVSDPAIEDRTREKLRLVVAVRAFAADSIRLRAKESFTTYSRLERDTLVLVLSAAHRDRLQMHTWWFPIVGRVPYKGYFDFKAARKAAAELEKQGLDAHVRPAAAFSTLGWFNDPLLSTTLRSDSLELANTVVHELTHNTFYASGQAIFNESFANFVGHRGAAWFFRSRGDSAAASKIDRRWSDDIALGSFWTSLYVTLDSAFKAHPTSKDERLVARDTVFSRAKRVLADNVAPSLRSGLVIDTARVRLDNAVVMSRRIYLTDLALFDLAYDREGRKLPATIARITALAKSRPTDPYGALRDWIAASPP